MAHKTIGRSYFIGGSNDEGGQRGYPRGNYYFAKYCFFCGKHVYLTEYEASDFYHNSKVWLDRRKWWQKIKEKIPHFRIVVEKGSEKEKEKASVGVWY